MGFVYVLYFIPFILWLWSYCGNDRERRIRRRKSVFLVFFAILWFFVSFRSNNVGADTQMYLYHYNQISRLEYSELSSYGYEIGYVFFVKLISDIFHSYEAYKILIAVIGMSASAYFYYKKSSSPISTIMMITTFGDLFGNFSGGRQTITTAIMLSSFTFVENKKPIKYICSIAISSLFHNSAWFALLIYPTYHIKLPKKMTPLLLLPIGLIYIFRERFFVAALAFSNAKYLAAYGKVLDTGAYLSFVFFLVLSLFVIFLTYEGASGETYTSGLVNILFLATVVQMFISVAHGMTRVNSYFMPFVPLAIEEAIHSVSPKYSPLARQGQLSLCVFFILYTMLHIYQTLGFYNMIPYSFSWD